MEEGLTVRAMLASMEKACCLGLGLGDFVTNVKVLPDVGGGFGDPLGLDQGRYTLASLIDRLISDELHPLDAGFRGRDALLYRHLQLYPG